MRSTPFRYISAVPQTGARSRRQLLRLAAIWTVPHHTWPSATHRRSALTALVIHPQSIATLGQQARLGAATTHPVTAARAVPRDSTNPRLRVQKHLPSHSTASIVSTPPRYCAVSGAVYLRAAGRPACLPATAHQQTDRHRQHGKSFALPKPLPPPSPCLARHPSLPPPLHTLSYGRPSAPRALVPPPANRPLTLVALPLLWLATLLAPAPASLWLVDPPVASHRRLQPQPAQPSSHRHRPTLDSGATSTPTDGPPIDVALASVPSSALAALNPGSLRLCSDLLDRIVASKRQ